jgi:hypothetical protein
VDAQSNRKTAPDVESRPGTPKVQVASAEPRIFGVVPPTLALLLGMVTLILGVALLVSGSALAGVVLMVSGAVPLALAIDAARRWPASALPRVTVRVLDVVSSRLGLARVSAGAWAEASREVIGLRRELRTLQGEREATQSALGSAAYHEDEAEMRILRARLTELDEQIEGREQLIGEVVERARVQVARERAAVAPTQPFAVPEEPPPLDDVDETRPAPTTPRRSHPAGSA